MWRRRSVAVNNAPALKLTSSVIRWPATNVWKPRDFRKFWICDQCYRRRTTNLPFNGITTADISHCRSSRNTKAFDRSFIRFASSEANNTGNLSNELPSQEERRRSSTSRRFSNVMDLVQSNVFIAGQRLNDLTGYSGIEALKRDIEQQEFLVQDTRVALQKSREDYSRAIGQRSGSQREVNELLQRKHNWTPNDLERFTALYRSDHTNEQAEVAAQEKLTALEKKSEEAAATLSASILARYHEEQIWSDKIRRMSTWGTWGLMGVNVLLFLVFQIGVEPWRRRRLVQGFEDKVMEALDREGFGSSNRTEVEELPERIVALPVTEHIQYSPTEDLEHQSRRADTILSTLTKKIPEMPALNEEASVPLATLHNLQQKFHDWFSDRQIVLRRVDLTTAIVEGAAAGAAFVGVLFFLLKPR